MAMFCFFSSDSLSAMAVAVCFQEEGQRRPADVIGNAVHVMRIATSEVDEPRTADGKNAAAVALGRKGGIARAKSLSARRRKEIAKKGANARHHK